MKTSIDILLHVRDLFYKKYKYWFMILEANTLFQGFDSIEYFENQDVFEITLTINKIQDVQE